MRPTKSTTSSSAKALSSDSIGTAWRTFLKRPDGAAPTFCDGEFARDEFRKSLLDGVEALAQRVVFGVGDARRIVLIVAPVVPLELERQPHQLDLGLRLGELGDVGERFSVWLFCHGREYDEDCDSDERVKPSPPSAAARRRPAPRR